MCIAKHIVVKAGLWVFFNTFKKREKSDQKKVKLFIGKPS